ncbi:anthranilate synthase component 1 [Corynebacterium sp. LK2590]|uniref:anthranilate synthase component 1 n=1 Tax=unclassified Corynebacterium TaxID=2624378 RepID=UPI0034CDD0F2
MTLVTASQTLAFHGDTAAVFQELSTPHDSLLLESADIQSKDSLNSLAVLTAAAKMVCQDDEVTATALTAAGQEIVSRLKEQFSHRLVDESAAQATFRFSRSTAIDERERLREESTVSVLRALQADAGYGDGMLPFVAGGFAFDYLAGFEELPAVADGANTYPDYEFIVAQELLHVDHQAGEAHLHVLGVDEGQVDQQLGELVRRVDGARDSLLREPSTVGGPNTTFQARADRTDEEFRGIVEQMKEHVHAGDIYQVVPARAFSIPCPDAFAAYRELRAANPSPYMFYVRGSDYELIGASPESNLKYDPETHELQLYPIAGTRPRGLNPDGSLNEELDVRNELDLRTDAKELAEHTMLVDLARNDLARVCVPGTRKVSALMQVDRYSRVMHLVSRVTGQLDEGLDALDAYRACMNMGTLSGAPKLKATELLRNAEGTRRGSYGGAVGYLRGDGVMDNCIAIRSAFIRGSRAIVQAGAGVVRDSSPQAEADETVHKAFAVLKAIATAHHAELEVIR